MVLRWRRSTATSVQLTVGFEEKQNLFCLQNSLTEPENEKKLKETLFSFFFKIFPCELFLIVGYYFRFSLLICSFSLYY